MHGASKSSVSNGGKCPPQWPLLIQWLSQGDSKVELEQEQQHGKPLPWGEKMLELRLSITLYGWGTQGAEGSSLTMPGWAPLPL